MVSSTVFLAATRDGHRLRRRFGSQETKVLGRLQGRVQRMTGSRPGRRMNQADAPVVKNPARAHQVHGNVPCGHEMVRRAIPVEQEIALRIFGHGNERQRCGPALRQSQARLRRPGSSLNVSTRNRPNSSLPTVPTKPALNPGGRPPLRHWRERRRGLSRNRVLLGAIRKSSPRNRSAVPPGRRDRVLSSLYLDSGLQMQDRLPIQDPGVLIPSSG